MQPFSKMDRRREIHHLYGQFCRVWSAGAKAKMEISSENGAIRASLEFDLGRIDVPKDATIATDGPLDTETCRVRCHRGPASKARSRARARELSSKGRGRIVRRSQFSFSQIDWNAGGLRDCPSTPEMQHEWEVEERVEEKEEEQKEKTKAKEEEAMFKTHHAGMQTGACSLPAERNEEEGPAGGCGTISLPRCYNPLAWAREEGC